VAASRISSRRRSVRPSTRDADRARHHVEVGAGVARFGEDACGGVEDLLAAALGEALDLGAADAAGGGAIRAEWHELD